MGRILKLERVSGEKEYDWDSVLVRQRRGNEDQVDKKGGRDIKVQIIKHHWTHLRVQ